MGHVNQAHSQCSESFYKKEVEHEIQSAPSKTPHERMRMMEMLKKFEEENQRSVSNGLGYDEEDADDLALRFQDIDMNSASAAGLWSKLTPVEQEQFRKIMEHPTSGIAQQLLASEELENEWSEPWWDAPTVEPDNAPGQSAQRRRYGAKPNVMCLPVAMVKPIPTGPPLFYNICVVW